MLLEGSKKTQQGGKNISKGLLMQFIEESPNTFLDQLIYVDWMNTSFLCSATFQHKDAFFFPASEFAGNTVIEDL